MRRPSQLRVKLAMQREERERGVAEASELRVQRDDALAKVAELERLVSDLEDSRSDMRDSYERALAEARSGAPPT